LARVITREKIRSLKTQPESETSPDIQIVLLDDAEIDGDVSLFIIMPERLVLDHKTL